MKKMSWLKKGLTFGAALALGVTAQQAQAQG